METAAPPRSFRIENGTIEALKWLAFILMVGDHVNKFLLNQAYPMLYAAGRMALPLFAFVLAYNLARPGALADGVHSRVMKRLAIFAVVASPFFGLLIQTWWPFNIMFTLALATLCIYLFEKGGVGRIIAGIVALVVLGFMVEFWWFALTTILTAWWFCKRPGWLPAFFFVLTVVNLYPVNLSWWALGALPILALAPKVKIKLPRLPQLFYYLYPAHLGILLAIRILMTR